MRARRWIELSMAVGVILVSTFTFGQQPAASNLAFEVATVRPSAPLDMGKMQAEVKAGRMPRLGAHIDASQAEYIYMPLRELVANAYAVKAYQISGPVWMATERFDIMAKMPEGATKDDAPKMLQALLAERFKLVAHRSNDEQPVWGLVVGKSGPRLKESPAAPEPIDPSAPLKPGEMRIDSPDGPVRMTRNSDGSTTLNMGAKGTITQRMDMQTQMLTLESSTVTMGGLADMLTRLLQVGGSAGRPVVDMTGLKGNYQVTLEVSLADLMAMARAQGINPPTPPGGGPAPADAAGAAPAAAASDPGGGSSVFGSVQKLGLKLEPRRAKVEQVVVDHVEKTPTEN